MQRDTSKKLWGTTKSSLPKDYYYTHNKLIYFLTSKEHYVNGSDKMVLKDSIELLKEEEEASLLPLTSHPFSAATDDDSSCLETKLASIALNCCE